MTVESTAQRKREKVAGPARGRLTPVLVRLHFYAGIFVGPFLLMIATTGLLYALAPQIDAVVFRNELTVDQVGTDRLPLTEQLRAARDAHPEGVVKRIQVFAGSDQTTRVMLAVEGVPDGYNTTVYVDPYSGRVKGARTSYHGQTPLRGWLEDLHRTLHLGAFGRNYSELAASWLWVIAIVGLVLWAGHRRRTGKLLRVAVLDVGETGRRRTRSWHSVVGVWILPMLLLLSATGLIWSPHGGRSIEALRAHLHIAAPVVDTGSARPSGGDQHRHGGHQRGGKSDRFLDDQRLAGVETVWKAAHRAGLSEPMVLSPPTAPGRAWRAAERKRDWPTRYDAIAVESQTGAITDRVDFADWPTLAKLITWGAAVHTGALFGVANQVLLALSAVGLIAIVFSGYRMWWQRRPTRGSAWAVGRAPKRGSGRRVSPGVVLATAVLTIAVGWLLPLFGCSLCVFFLVDLSIGAGKRWMFRHAGRQRPS